MPRYKLRTLLILVAILPPLLGAAWVKYAAWRAEQERLELIKLQTKAALLADQQEMVQRAVLREERLAEARQIIAAELAAAKAKAAAERTKRGDQPPPVAVPHGTPE